MKRLLIAVVLAAGSVPIVAARTWTSGNGRYTTEAEILDFKEGQAQLKKNDGTVIEVPLASLCAKDQQYIKKQFPGAQDEQFRPGADFRSWKSASGKFSTLAEFLGYADGCVQLRKPDGSEISVEKKLLSTADQRWIADELRRMHEEEEQAGKDKGGEISGQIAEQDIAMNLVRLDAPKGRSRGKTSAPADYIFRLTNPQSFYMELGKSAAKHSDFNRVVHKEPAYSLPNPFRGTATLGGRQYGFALDAVGPRASGYNRLYFDLHGNGDLTDDKPIAALSTTMLRPGMCQVQFPRVDMTLDAMGSRVEYAFLLNALCCSASSPAYASVSLYSAVAREGYITQGAKRTKLMLIDSNSNGRFDDRVSITNGGSAVEGDMLLINPDTHNRLAGDATMGRDRNFVNKTVCIGKEFYRMEVTPAGDHLKLAPFKLTLGSVSNPSPLYRAVLFSDDYGALMIGGMKDRKVPLPEGSWKVVSYTIDGSAFAPGTAVAASFGSGGTPVTVSSGQTAQLRFGAPFHAAVTAERSGGKLYLSMAVVGVGGERCSNMYVKGVHPPHSLFIIKDASGKVVQQGSFEYG